MTPAIVKAPVGKRPFMSATELGSREEILLIPGAVENEGAVR